ncbi:MAG: hypothetical protein ACTHJQ_07990 [Rhizobiaceae bacterium]
MQIEALTEEQAARLRVLDRTGVIMVSDWKLLPGIHFCPDWDHLPVCNASPEISGCTCRALAAGGSDAR